MHTVSYTYISIYTCIHIHNPKMHVGHSKEANRKHNGHPIATSGHNIYMHIDIDHNICLVSKYLFPRCPGPWIKIQHDDINMWSSFSYLQIMRLVQVLWFSPPQTEAPDYSTRLVSPKLEVFKSLRVSYSMSKPLMQLPKLGRKHHKSKKKSLTIDYRLW